MKEKIIVCLLMALTAALCLTRAHVQAQEGEGKNAGKPTIGLILAKPPDEDPTKKEADNHAPEPAGGGELPVAESASEDGQAENRIETLENLPPATVEDETPAEEDESDYFSRGVGYDISGMYRKAVEAYKAAIGIKPDYAVAYYNLAVSYLMLEESDAAYNEYSLLKNIDPLMAESLYAKALSIARSNPENKYAVQAGAFRNIQYARELLEQLKTQYMYVHIEEEGGLHKVRVSGMKDREDADRMKKDISEKFKIAPFVVPLR